MDSKYKINDLKFESEFKKAWVKAEISKLADIQYDLPNFDSYYPEIIFQMKK